MSRNAVLIGLLLVGLRAAPAAAQLPDADQPVVDRYRAAMQAVRTGDAPHALETAFEIFGALRDTLMSPRKAHLTLLESLPEASYQALVTTVPGAILERENSVIVMPDPVYFDSLAAARGDSADCAFFAAYRATQPDGIWPVYLDQKTDEEGCTRFGSLSLVDTYAAWSTFRRRYPGRYAGPVTEEIRAVLGQLTQSTCACGDLRGARRELETFQKRFPKSPVGQEIEWRLEAIRAGRSNIRPGCG